MLQPWKQLIGTLLLAALTSPAVAAQSASTPAVPPQEHVLARLIVIGASVSHGFGLRVNLADALHASIARPHERPLDGTLGDFFNATDELRRQIVEKALVRKPTAVVAVDFLFWYVNSSLAGDVQREHLEQGLAALGRFECPVVTSLLPDMSSAPGFLFAAQRMPRGPELAELNERIKAWAAKTPNIVLIPLPETMEAIRQGRKLRVGAWSWKAGASERFLQADGTHPTEMGLVLIACLVNEGLRARVPGLAPGAFQPDKGEILGVLRAIERVRELNAPKR